MDERTLDRCSKCGGKASHFQYTKKANSNPERFVCQRCRSLAQKRENGRFVGGRGHVKKA
jgi:hypothetical protein